MARIIAGHFGDIEQLREAVARLRERGFTADDYATYYLNPPGGHGLYRISFDAENNENAPGAGVGAATGAAAGGAAGLAIGIVGGPMGALAGGGIGAYIGSLMGALGQMDQLETEDAGVEHPDDPVSGPMIAVNAVGGKAEQQAIDVVMRCSPLQVDRARGDWQHGEWVDFDPREPVETLHRREEPART